MVDIPAFTRRRALSALSAIGTVSFKPVFAAEADETPVDKVYRLADELARALDNYTGGGMHAVVFPASSGFGVNLRITSLPEPVTIRNS